VYDILFVSLQLAHLTVLYLTHFFASATIAPATPVAVAGTYAPTQSPVAAPTNPSSSPATSSSNTTAIIVGVVVGLGGGLMLIGGLAYYFLVYSKQAEASAGDDKAAPSKGGNRESFEIDNAYEPRQSVV
jgi:hypothetical protein